ncbi:Phosphatidate cytidylyltransferase, mitochondrial [Armadillidium nasatum]|uniref:Phosphatidate cytidylyltransferase, mitochondrial n=1 Tax=Armadillidium nasatum TaxID=96803 RepID=A0A5N5SPP6_9CRUS|nr:Phosphatidate cytidylyltransferase, mitochondrial [Armadillidium nasatum]
METIYYDIFKKIFPAGASFAFAYGSSVFKQIGHTSSKNTMIDFVLAVEDPLEWHSRNLDKNPSHYSMLKYVGPKYISMVQNSFGAKVYYNTLIPTQNVISTEDLVSDLLDWDTLYIAGRLHKPVSIVYIDNKNEELKNALKINLYSALRTALLILPETFTEQQLYTTIAGLSYSGDFRMQIGEDQNKVQNIVLGQMEEFRQLYLPLLRDLKDFVIVDYTKATGQQDISASTKLFHLSMLPKMLQLEIAKEWIRNGRIQDLEDVVRAAALDPDTNDLIFKGVTNIVQKSSFSQSAKGILTAGIIKSIIYSVSKLKKMWRSWHEDV